MAKIILGGLKEEGDELAAFLAERIPFKPSREGDEVRFEGLDEAEGLRPGVLKSYVKRFLHNRGLRTTYRVLVEGGELRLVRLEGEEEE